MMSSLNNQADTIAMNQDISTTSTESNKSNLKRKNVDNDDQEAVEAKSKPLLSHEDAIISTSKIKTRSQTARAKHNNIDSKNLEISSKIEENIIRGYKNDQVTEEWLNTFREWNSKFKLNALEQILEICEHSHIKHVHNFIEPKLQRDYISELPRELVLLLLTYVRPKDLYKLAQVSNYWQLIANDTILWKNICKRHNIDLSNLNNNTSMILNELKSNNGYQLDSSISNCKTSPLDGPTTSSSIIEIEQISEVEI
jgi:hypothetical protein